MMKKLLVGLTLLASVSSFADTFEEAVATKVSAVFGLMKCLPQQAQNGINICYEEIDGAVSAKISNEFIVELLNKRNIELQDFIDGKSTSWYWVKTYAMIDKI